MFISIVNFTASITDARLQEVIRAINRQVREDFEPHWHMGATLRLEGRIDKTPEPASASELRGDAIIYVYDGDPDVDGALGYHEANYRGLPYGFVFTKISEAAKEDWSVTLSHETLELIADATVNTFAAGPHPDPAEKGRIVFHWYEMCDAVQAETYSIDGILVSNFVLPLYFTPEEQKGARNDFLGNHALRSFNVNPGGYLGFFDPTRNGHVTWHAAGDGQASARLDAKQRVKQSRRAVRYTTYGQTPPTERVARHVRTT